MLLIAGLYLVLIALLGYVVASMLLGAVSKSTIEIAGLSFAIGCGVLSLVLLVASLCGVKPSRLELMLIAGVSVTAIFVLRSRGRLLRSDISGCLSINSIRWDAWFVLGLFSALLILFASLNVAATSLTHGLADVDAFAIWMFKAKIVSADALRPIPTALLDPSLSYSHQDYPLGMPLLAAGINAATGSDDIQAARAIFLPMYLSLIAIIYSALRQSVRPAIALAITAALVAAPIVVNHAGRGVAELPLLMFFTAAISLLLRWMETGRRADLLASAVFAAFAAFTKNEGLAMLPLIGLTALAFSVARHEKKRFFDVALAAALAFLLISPWLMYRRALPRTHEDYGGKLVTVSTLIQHVPRLRSIIPSFFGQFFNTQQAGLLWIVLVISCMLGWQAFRRLPVAALWALLFAQLALYVVTLMVTPWDLNTLLPMIGPKLLMQASPAAALLIGQHLKPKQDHF